MKRDEFEGLLANYADLNNALVECEIYGGIEHQKEVEDANLIKEKIMAEWDRLGGKDWVYDGLLR
jgi:hypothetical protein